MNRSVDSISEKLERLSLEKNINKTDIDNIVQELKVLEENNIRNEEEVMKKSQTSRSLFEHERQDKIYIQVEKTMNQTQPLFGDNNKMDIEDWLFKSEFDFSKSYRRRKRSSSIKLLKRSSSTILQNETKRIQC